MGLEDKVVWQKRYSDSRIFAGFVKWSGWKELGNSMTQKHYKPIRFFALLCGRLISWFVELFSQSARFVTRAKVGRQSTGVLLVLSVAWLMLLYNHERSFQAWLDFYRAVALAFWGIVSMDDIAWKGIASDLWKPQSKAMAIHFGLVVVSGMVQLIGLWFSRKWLDTDNSLQKGTSWICVLSKQRSPLVKDYIHVLFEPALITLVGLLFWYILDDRIYASFLFIAAPCLFYQEFMDYTARKLNKS